MENKIITLCHNGDVDAIKTALNHKGALYRMNGIIGCVSNKIKDDDVISTIKKLLSDDVVVSGYMVSDFALAALDILNITKYTGNSEKIKALIKCKFQF